MFARRIAICTVLVVCLVAAMPSAAWADEDAPQAAALETPDAIEAAARDGADNPESNESAKPDYASMSLDDLVAAVEEKTANRDAVDAQRRACESRLRAVNVQISALESQLLPAELQANQAVVERYKLQRHGAALIDALLAAPDFETLVTQAVYVERISAVELDVLSRLRYQRMGLRLKQNALSNQNERITAQLEEITADLDEAIRARDEAQRKADLVANAQLSPDGADWEAGEEAFVAEWAPRIDAYLEGSPLAGQGTTFAKAAWDNHVDPRWSPAISHIESGKGRVCIRPHNAWGWGAADSDPYNLASEWMTWEDAINAHVSGLARGYGYTISVEGAQKYCPPGWEEWYAITIAQMNSI